MASSYMSSKKIAYETIVNLVSQSDEKRIKLTVLMAAAQIETGYSLAMVEEMLGNLYLSKKLTLTSKGDVEICKKGDVEICKQ